MPIKSFKDYFEDQGATYVFYHYDGDDVLAGWIVGQLLGEAKKSVDLPANRKVYFHKAHSKEGQDHLHFYAKGAHLFALNMDGTAHDRSHGVRMQRWAIDAVKDNWEGFVVPPNGLIEALMVGSDTDLIVESFGKRDAVLVTSALQRAAEQRAEGI